ncbi:MAG: hypothetical protein QG657_5269 [Acidobacteriota bacterium]|nr:hypothetical protein [Acidobacteriota bacterium]
MVSGKKDSGIVRAKTIVLERSAMEQARHIPFIGYIPPISKAILISIENPTSTSGGTVISLVGPKEEIIIVEPGQITSQYYGGLHLDKGLTIKAFAGNINLPEVSDNPENMTLGIKYSLRK